MASGFLFVGAPRFDAPTDREGAVFIFAVNTTTGLMPNTTSGTVGYVSTLLVDGGALVV